MEKALSRIIYLLLFVCIFTDYGFSQTVNDTSVRIDITNVVINGGNVHLNIFSTAENFRNETPDFIFILEGSSTVVSAEVSLSNGEYLISAFQDANNNGKLDTGLFGIPKELVGLSNYFGRGYPSNNFDRQKIPINNSTGRITIGLYRF